MPKRRLRKSLAVKALKPARSAIVVASTGRAGSTMVWNAIARAWLKARQTCLSKALCGDLPANHILRTAWRLDEAQLCPGYVYKTHDLPRDALANKRVKVVFTFSRPDDTIRSVHRTTQERGVAWFEDHLRHLGASGRAEDLFDTDVLRYEAQVKSWMSVTQGDVLLIKYEHLWDEREALSRFLGFPVEFPPYCQRGSGAESCAEIRKELLERLMYVYDAAPAFALSRPVSLFGAR